MSTITVVAAVVIIILQYNANVTDVNVKHSQMSILTPHHFAVVMKWHPHHWCELLIDVSYPLLQILYSCSVWLLVAITLERYLAICWPMAVRIHATRAKSKFAVLTILIVAVGYNVVRFWEYEIGGKPKSANESSNAGLRSRVNYWLW